MVVLSTKNICKSYGIDEILKNLTFNINEGDKIGLVGANGAGKSTLFKIITGSLSADSGDLYVDKNKSVGYLSQHLSLDSENTIYEEVLTVFDELLKMQDKLSQLEEKMNEPYDENNPDYHNKLIQNYNTTLELFNNRGGYTFKGEIHRVLCGLGFVESQFENKIGILSGGQKTRVALCKLLLQSPQILLLDEPTNHLDLGAIEWLEEYLKAYKGTIFIISHDRFFLDAITTYTFELINKKVEIYNGNYTKYIDLKKKRYEEQLKAFKLQSAEIKRQEDIIERYRSFNREKSIRAAESREKALSKVERLEQPMVESKIKSFTFETLIKSGNDVMHVEKLGKSYDPKVLFNDVSFDVRREERIALIGENGRGKTTLFKIILDELKPSAGSISLGKNVFCGYYDQEQSNLDEQKTILDEVWDAFPHLTTTELRNALAAFLFTGEDVFKKISSLSGGEKCRINLLKLILSKNNFLLLDEPTNHLDIMSREMLEEALLSYDGTLLVISHDRYFLNKVVNRILELEENGLTEYLGNYSYYVDKKANPTRFDSSAEATGGKTKTAIAEERRKKREEEKQAKESAKRLKTIEETIAKTEAQIVSLQEKLCLEEVYSNPEESTKIHSKISELENEVAALYEEWEQYV